MSRFLDLGISWLLCLFILEALFAQSNQLVLLGRATRKLLASNRTSRTMSSPQDELSPVSVREENLSLLNEEPSPLLVQEEQVSVSNKDEFSPLAVQKEHLSMPDKDKLPSLPDQKGSLSVLNPMELPQLPSQKEHLPPTNQQRPLQVLPSNYQSLVNDSDLELNISNALHDVRNFTEISDNSTSSLDHILGTSPDYEEDEEPSCQRNCTELNPEAVQDGCPALQRGLTCGKYTVFHYHRRCLIATVFCHRNLTSNKEVAVYVAAYGTDLNRNKTGLFVLPYFDDKEGYIPPLVLEKPYHGNGGKGELVCGEKGKWILYDVNYRYEVEHLFCLVSGAKNLNYLLDLVSAGRESNRQAQKPFRRGDDEFFNL